AELGVGYVAVFFADSERETQQSPAVSASLNGAISLDRLTLLSLGLNHSTDLTTADEAALVTTTQFATSINRLLTRASALLAGVRLSRSDFVDESRTDHDVVAELAYSHDLFRSVALNVGYRFSQRFSDDSEDDFYRNVVSVGLSASF
ncbi:MAG TPA: outer membrane beta-barrel protein, partial [Kofleriaceae bacterium]|nr:outer membrane beta-barrel protein [Kofleriaceae bacterium]